MNLAGHPLPIMAHQVKNRKWIERALKAYNSGAATQLATALYQAPQPQQTSVQPVQQGSPDPHDQPTPKS